MIKINNLSPFRIIIVFLILSFLGFILTSKLSIRLNSNNYYPSLTVNYYWKNSSSYLLERKVTTILESGFSSIIGLSNISSISSNGSGQIILEFDKNIDIEIARFEVSTIIRQLYKKLPNDVSYPAININKPNDENNFPFVTYTINSDKNSSSIQNVVKNQIEPHIGSIRGVNKTEIQGESTDEYLIKINEQLCRKHLITRGYLIEVLQEKMSNLNLGKIQINKNHISLAIRHENTSLDNIPIKTTENRIIYLGDIAEINKKEKDKNNYFRVNGKNSISLSVYSEKNTNTILLFNEVNNKIEEIKTKLPNGYNLFISYNSTDYLKNELNKVYFRSLFTLMILLLFVLVITKSYKYLLLILISLIVNIGISFLFYFLLNIEIQLYSIAGITISLGLIIDNSIIVINNLKNKFKTNVFTPLLASTLTTIGALIVVFFLDEEYKINLVDFALVIIINLIVSLFVAFFLIPILVLKFNFHTKTNQNNINFNIFFNIYEALIRKILKKKAILLLILFFLFGTPIFLLPNRIDKEDNIFDRFYNKTLGNQWYIENVRPSVDVYLGGSLRLFNKYVLENSYQNTKGETKLFIIAKNDKELPIHNLNKVFLRIERYLNNFDGIKNFNTIIYNNNYSKIEITFNKDVDETAFPKILTSLISKELIEIGGIEWNVYGIGDGFNNFSRNNNNINFTVKAKGFNYEKLNSLCDTLGKRLIKHPRVNNLIVKENSFRENKPNYNFNFNFKNEILSLTGTEPYLIMEQIKSTSSSNNTEFESILNNVFTTISLESKTENNYLWNLKNNPIEDINNVYILNNLINEYKDVEEEDICKENQEYIKLVQFQYTGSLKFGSTFLNNELKKIKEELPLGFSFERIDEKKLISDEKNNYLFALIIIILIIYFICSILFENLKQPLIILSVIPISFIGVFLIFYFFKYNFDQGGFVSFVILSGITVNSSILILDLFNKLKKKFPKKDMVQLYVDSLKQNIFPILLTNFSTVLGFIPFLLSGKNEVFWFALGLGTTGGVLFSMISIFLFLPIFALKNPNNFSLNKTLRNKTKIT